MSMIDAFRGLSHLDAPENRRVKFVDNQDGTWTVQAKDHLWGRIVSWFRHNDPVDLNHYKAQQNNQVREEFYKALVKAEGERFANYLIDKVFGENAHATFQTRGRALQVSRINQVLKLAETEREKFTTQTMRVLQNYDNVGGLDTYARAYANTLGHDDFPAKDPELRRTLKHLVKSHPDYGRRLFSNDELRGMVAEATRRCCEARRQRFEEQYPGLSSFKLIEKVPNQDDRDKTPFHDTATFFTKMQEHLGRPPFPEQLQPFKILARDSLGLIRDTYRIGSDMRFNPDELRPRIDILEARKTAMRQRLDNLRSEAIENALVGDDDDTVEARALRDALCIELEAQIGKLDAKLAFFGDYLKHDPLSEKSIAYHKLVLRQASKTMLEELSEEIGLKVQRTKDPEELKKLKEDLVAMRHAINHAEERITLAREELEKAKTDRLPLSECNRRIKQDRSNEVNFVSAQFNVVGHTLPLFVTVAKLHDQAQVKVLDNVQEWHTITRDFSVSRDGVDRNYRSVMKPGPKLEGPVGQSYEKDELKGVSAGNKTEPNHPRNLWVSELYRVEKVIDPQTGKVVKDPDTGKDLEITVKLSQTIRHGVLDPWSIEDPEERMRASEAGVEEVLTTVVDVNENFKKRALQKKLHPELEDPNTFVDGRPKRNKIVHINLNLTTADTSLLRKPMRDFREGDFTLNQFTAFESYNGTHALKVGVSNDNVPQEEDGNQVEEGNGVDGNLNQNDNVNEDGNVDLNGNVQENNQLNVQNQNDPPQQELIIVDMPGGHQGFNLLNLQNEIEGNVPQEPLILELPPNNPPGNVQVGGNDQQNQFFLNPDEIDNPPNVPPNDGQNPNLVPGNLQGNNDNQVGQNDLQLVQGNNVNQVEGVNPNDQVNQNVEVNPNVQVNPNDQLNPNVQVNQVNQAPVIDEDGNTEIEFDIDTITFSFGVNEVAMGQGIWALHTDQTLWGLVEQHDRDNMIKLIGDLNEGSYPGGYIGDIFDRLNELAADPNTSPQDRRKLLDLVGQLQREVETARTMFNSGSYKSGIEDAYKMARSVMRIVNLGAQGLDLLGDDENLLSLSQGCKSNKDRGGMGDVEHKAQVVIEDMGGHVEPGKPLPPQDQTIYNIVLTSSGQDEIQRLNTGLPGSKNAGDLKARINDPEAELTAKALSHHSNA